MSNTPVYVPGVWGPYYSAMLPGYYLNEGRQSSAGQLVCIYVATLLEWCLEFSLPSRIRLREKVELLQLTSKI